MGAGSGFFFLFFDLSKMGNSQLSPFVLSFGGKASSFLDYEQRVTLWVRFTDVPVERQSTLLILHMDPTARQVCMYNSGGDTLMAGCDAQEPHWDK